MKEIEDEAAKLRKMTAQAEKEMGMMGDGGSSSGGAFISAQNSVGGTDMIMTTAQSEAQDARSIYIGNVDYGATPEELHAHFQSCGTIIYRPSKRIRLH